MVFSLSNTAVDYEDIRQQFIEDLGKRDAWKDSITAGVGQTLADWYAAIGAYEQYAIERSVEESMLVDGARQDSSIICATRMLGVHVQRRIPGHVTVEFTNAAPLVPISVPAFTQFVINGRYFFNRTSFFFNTGDTTLTVVLHEGQIVVEEIISDGNLFQRYILGNGQNIISDIDIHCTVEHNNQKVPFSRIITGPWHMTENEFSFYENTMPNGDVEVRFGNDVFGLSPRSGKLITFTYVRTQGLDGNIETSGEPVETALSTDLRGTTMSAVAGGDAAKEATFYKIFAPGIYSAKERMVTRPNYHSLVFEHPGIIDGKFRGQKEIAPTDVRWMNLVEYTILTSPAFTDEQHADFVEWLHSKAIYQVHYLRADPTQIDLDITLTIQCKERADLLVAKTAAETAVAKLFVKRPGILGYSFSRSDIYGAAKNSDANIEIVTSDTLPEMLPAGRIDYYNLRSLIITPEYSTRSVR